MGIPVDRPLLRTDVYKRQVAAMLILPAIWGVTGVWLATPAAELLALSLSLIMFFRYRKRYQY